MIESHFVEGLDHFEATFEGAYGAIKSGWKKRGTRVDLDIVILPIAATLILSGDECRVLSAGSHRIRFPND
ncbi:hypothetical protein JHJ32_08900 [Parapedobacter sp. ISTM3]|nr:hypothetical protein [Parapedobacter sp. ISTM3]